MRLLAWTQYDGTDFSGWQKQKGLRTVQGVLEKALSDLFCENIKVYGSSRTDAGAHAVCHPVVFEVPEKYSPEEVASALNARLPSDVKIMDVKLVSNEFSPLKEARARTYVYLIALSRQNKVFLENYAYFLEKPLQERQLKKFTEALLLFKGTHDFTSFSKADSKVKSRVRTIMDIEIFESGGLIAVRLTADGFLYGMIRSIIGAALSCASGRLEKEEITKMLEGKKESGSLQLVPASGLFLYQVWFKEKGLNFSPKFPFIDIPLNVGL